ncbi:MAG TPA: hypothetical protein VET66_14380 [Steroidobacteraceae bacterium]|nr:hypothetical protein [Steroidobacteraceae bacterium]
MNRHDPRAAVPASGLSRKPTDRLARHLLRRAAHRAPPELAERLLDGGALALARAGSGHYRPATEDGRPVSACFPFRIRFEMR